ncbi:MAG: hypothetical protein ACRDD2_01080, partial [Sarcina sp.]
KLTISTNTVAPLFNCNAYPLNSELNCECNAEGEFIEIITTDGGPSFEMQANSTYTFNFLIYGGNNNA